MSRIFPCLMLIGLLGCDSGVKKVDLPDTVPVSGSVTLDGKPLESAVVTFSPTGATKGVDCLGLTDKEGKFKLKQLRGKDGAPQGAYRVSISQMKRGDGTIVAPAFTDSQEIGKGGIAVETLPPRYSNPNESKLDANVAAGGGDFKFELKSK